MMGTGGGGGGGGLARIPEGLFGFLKMFVKAAFVLAAIVVITIPVLRELVGAGVDVTQIGVEIAGVVPDGLKALFSQAQAG